MSDLKVPALRFPEFAGAWEAKKLGEVFNWINTNSLSREMLSFEKGSIQNIHYGDIHTKFNAHFYQSKECVPFILPDALPNLNEEQFCLTGDLVIADASEDYADIGKAIEIIEARPNSLVAGLHTYIARPAKNTFIIGFVSYILKTEAIRLQIMRIAQGISVLGISKGNLSKLQISFPTLPEQQKIAAFLTQVDDKLKLLEQKRDALKAYKKGMMQQLFSQTLRFKQDDGSDFPDWEEKKMGEVCSFIKDGTHGTHMDTKGGGHWLLSAKNLQNGQVQIDQTDREISKYEFEMITKNYFLEKNDLLLSIVGTIGRVALFDGTKNIAFQRSVAFFRMNLIEAHYAYQLMNAYEFQKELLKRQVTSAQPGIYLGDLAKISVAFPCLSEQQKIANFLSAIDEKIEGVQAKITTLQAYKKGLLQQMFV